MCLQILSYAGASSVKIENYKWFLDDFNKGTIMDLPLKAEQDVSPKNIQFELTQPLKSLPSVCWFYSFIFFIYRKICKLSQPDYAKHNTHNISILFPTSIKSIYYIATVPASTESV